MKFLTKLWEILGCGVLCDECVICYESVFVYNRCFVCNNIVCDDCYQKIELCPMCRTSYATQKITLSVVLLNHYSTL